MTRTTASAAKSASKSAAKSTRRSARPRAAAKTNGKDTTSAGAKTPLLDLRKLLEKLKLPELNVGGLIDSRRKDIEALMAANEQVYRGFEAVARRQAAMLSEAMKGLKRDARDTMAADGARARAGRAAELAKEAFGQALANMKELAELSARSQQQVIDTLNKRLRESLSEAGGRLVRRD